MTTEFVSQIWDHLGQVPNFVEPFGCSPVLLERPPFLKGTETVNDLNCEISNFWRASTDLDLAEWAAPEDYQPPDLLEFQTKMHHLAEFYDVKYAVSWGLRMTKAPILTQKIVSDLRNRLHKVRVCCGDWERVLSPVVTSCQGLTGVYLQPKLEDNPKRIIAWCQQYENDPLFHIALKQVIDPSQQPLWDSLGWPSQEGVLYSPHCLNPEDNVFKQFQEELCQRP